ncbi:unnamed protein product [Symbiodinium pilosum]|uniref:Uncharacterized protein n=1 Tax=Symbiodinium pilosum TaxID=2952 RepID=A0A812UXU6_SYMPI|nr:unnamed protein product [Symbiodinium pilosum]
MDAMERYCFVVRQRINVLFRGNLKSVAVVCSSEPGPGQTVQVVDHLNVQEEDGSWSSEYIDICREMGL